MDEPVRRRLTELLASDPVPEVRAEAARALSVAAHAAPDVVEPLVAALGDDDPGVRRAATLALGRVDDHEHAVEALVRALTERPELWEEVSAALATAGDLGLLDRLVALLDDETPEVRRGTLRAIAAISSRHVAPADREPLFVYTDDEGHRHPLF